MNVSVNVVEDDIRIPPIYPTSDNEYAVRMRTAIPVGLRPTVWVGNVISHGVF
jgi:hypothetical protein